MGTKFPLMPTPGIASLQKGLGLPNYLFQQKSSGADNASLPWLRQPN